jgi:PII-like signaling protein
MTDIEVKWINLGKELQTTSNGATVLRMLMGHGVTHLVKMGDKGIRQSCSIEMVLDYYHKV